MVSAWILVPVILLSYALGVLCEVLFSRRAPPRSPPPPEDVFFPGEKVWLTVGTYTASPNDVVAAEVVEAYPSGEVVIHRSASKLVEILTAEQVRKWLRPRTEPSNEVTHAVKLEGAKDRGIRTNPETREGGASATQGAAARPSSVWSIGRQRPPTA